LVVVLVEAAEEGVEVVTAVAPVERARGGVVAVLEGQDPCGEVGEVREVGGVDGFALQDGEVDLY